MRHVPFLNASRLKRLLKSFTAFLGVLVGLLTVHYPVLPEKMLPLYGADRQQALNLGEFLSALAFAASLVAVVLAWRSHLGRGEPADAVGAKGLLRLGVVLLLVASLGCLVHFALVRVSTRVTRAVYEAQKREIEDRFARDTLAKLRDRSIGFVEAYVGATEFLEAERIPAMAFDEVLRSAKDPSYGGTLILTYATTMLCFKVGLFYIAVGLALVPSLPHLNPTRLEN